MLCKRDAVLPACAASLLIPAAPLLVLHQIILNDKVAYTEGVPTATDSGVELHADLVYWATGTRSTSQWVAAEMPDVLDSHLRVRARCPCLCLAPITAC